MKNRTKNPYRQIKQSYKYKVWNQGYDVGLQDWVKKNNPYACPIVPEDQREHAKIWSEGFDSARADIQEVPEGSYCYQSNKKCPYWSKRRALGKKSQNSGYCRLLRAGDFVENDSQTMLLWDQVKECGIKTKFVSESDQEDFMNKIKDSK